MNTKQCPQEQGVSVLISKKYKQQINSLESINERIINTTIQIKGRTRVLHGIYASNDDELEAMKDDFETSIREILDKTPNRCKIIIAGYLNSRVGQCINSPAVRKHGEPTANNNGETLTDLCKQYNLRITNTFYEHKNIHKYIWYYRSRDHKSIIDYVCNVLIIKDLTQCRNMGIAIDEDIFYTLFLADDQLAVSEDMDDLSYMIRKLQAIYEKCGLRMNIKKLLRICHWRTWK